MLYQRIEHLGQGAERLVLLTVRNDAGVDTATRYCSLQGSQQTVEIQRRDGSVGDHQ